MPVVDSTVPAVNSLRQHDLLAPDEHASLPVHPLSARLPPREPAGLQLELTGRRHLPDSISHLGLFASGLL